MKKKVAKLQLVQNFCINYFFQKKVLSTVVPLPFRQQTAKIVNLKFKILTSTLGFFFFFFFKFWAKQKNNKFNLCQNDINVL